jgi:pimeloyl-ACP methyl ester carboxylesterase
VSHFAELRFTSRDGLTLYARDYAAASGPARLPVICLHGLTRNSADFDELAPWLASLNRRVLAPDMRGRGHSQHDADPTHYAPPTYAADVAKLAHDLGIARAVFIGTSMGGIITMTLALGHAKLIAAAVLNDTGPLLSSKGLQRIAGYAGARKTPATWSEAAQAVRAINATAFPDNPDEEWMKWARRAFHENEQGELEMRYDPNIALPLSSGKLLPSSMAARHAFKKLARKRPTLLVRGKLSDLIEDEQTEWMRKHAPRMRYAEVPGIGHAPMLTEPAAQEALHAFLAQVD